MRLLRIFRPTRQCTIAIKQAIKKQLDFERTHSIPYAPDQRLRALRARAEGAYGRTLPSRGVAQLKEAVAAWDTLKLVAQGTP